MSKGSIYLGFGFPTNFQADAAKLFKRMQTEEYGLLMKHNAFMFRIFFYYFWYECRLTSPNLTSFILQHYMY